MSTPSPANQLGDVAGSVSPTDSDVLQDDLRDLLEALRLPSGAQPRSPHAVFRYALGEVKRMRGVLYMCAAHCQGGHSLAGETIAELLSVPFPLRMEELAKAAKRDGFEPYDLWPWLKTIHEREGRLIA